MYFDWRLFGLTRGVRLRILYAAALGLIAVGAGVARLAVSGVVIYRVLAGQASFSALVLPMTVFAHAISSMIVAILIPGGLLVVLAVMSWPIAATLAPFLVAVAASPFFANKRIERLGDEIRGRMGDIHAYMVDSIQGMREISAFGRGADRNDQLTEKGWAYAGHLVRFQKSQAFQIGFMEVMMGLGGLAVLAMGVWLVLEGQIARSQLPLVSVLALASFSPVTELARTMKQMMETLAASRRVLAIHDETVPVRDGPGVKESADENISVTPSVEFQEVAFAYSEGDPQALADVSFEIGSGQTVAIVGRSGAGKTTSAYLTMRFWDPDRGDIVMEGHRLDEFRLDDLRGRAALVAQDTYLFNNTIRENIRLGREEATDSDVEEAARQANAVEFIESFPDGYDTHVGERGMQLGRPAAEDRDCPRYSQERSGADSGRGHIALGRRQRGYRSRRARQADGGQDDRRDSAQAVDDSQCG